MLPKYFPKHSPHEDIDTDSLFLTLSPLKSVFLETRGEFDKITLDLFPLMEKASTYSHTCSLPQSVGHFTCGL